MKRNRHRTNIFISFLIFYLVSPMKLSFAQTLSLNEVLEVTLKYHPLILSAQQEFEKTKGDALSTRGSFDPVLKANTQNTPLGYYKSQTVDTVIEQPTPFWGSQFYVGWRKGQGSFPVYDGKQYTFDRGEWRVGVDVPLLKNSWIDERRAKVMIFNKSVEVAEQQLKNQKIDLTKQVTQKYWDWVGAIKKLKISQNYLGITHERNEAIINRVKSGDLARIDQTENQRAVIQRQSALLQAERNLQKIILELSLFFQEDELLSFTEKKFQPQEFPDIEEVLQDEKRDNMSLFQHPEITRIGLQIEQLEIQKNYSKNAFLPKLNLQIGFSKDIGVNTNPNFVIPSGYTTEMKIAVTFEMPLFFRNSQGVLDSSEASYQKLAYQLDFSKDQIQMRLTDLQQTMSTSKKKVDLARQEVTISKELEGSEKMRLEQGDSNLLILNLREQNTIDAEIREVDAIVEYLKAKADFEAIALPTNSMKQI